MDSNILKKNIKKLNKKTMKEVWNFYNKSYKHRTQTKIQVETEEEKRDFMSYWNNLY